MKTVSSPTHPAPAATVRGLRRSALALACLLTIGCEDRSQAQPTLATPSKEASSQANGAQATLSVDARLVTLPVTVRDKKGKLVTGLSKEDFMLTEDGRPETIKYLNLDTNLPLTVGLLADTSRSMRDALDRERSASKSFLDQMMAAPANPAPEKGNAPAKVQDKAFLLHFDSEVELLQDVTSSRDKLEMALGQLGPTSGADLGSEPDDSQSRGGRRAHGGTTLYDAIYLASDELMRKQQGRKALIVFSDGVDRGSKETLTSAIEAAQRAETVVYSVYFKGEEHGGGGFSPDQGGGRRGGVGGGYPGGGYPGGGGGYPGGGGRRGGGGQGPAEEPHVDGKKIMAQIAGETGGWFFEAKKKENLDEIYAQISEQLRTQYVLAYTPDKDSTLTGFHKIQLTVNKKDLTVQTRPGYYADR
jgi:VWFA-related protein